MKIAVDAMGGDFAPKEIVAGAILAAKRYDCEIVLVGDQTQIQKSQIKLSRMEKKYHLHSSCQ